MWIPEHRRATNRCDLRYPSDLTDDEWAVVAPMIPPGRHGGRKRSYVTWLRRPQHPASDLSTPALYDIQNFLSPARHVAQ